MPDTTQLRAQTAIVQMGPVSCDSGCTGWVARFPGGTVSWCTCRSPYGSDVVAAVLAHMYPERGYREQAVAHARRHPSGALIVEVVGP